MGRTLGRRVPLQKETSKDERIAEAQALEDKTSEMSLTDKLVFGQPGRVKAEENIAARKSIYPEFEDSFKAKPDGVIEGLLNAGNIGLKSLMLADERTQGAIAGPMLESLDPYRKDIAQDATMAAIDGLSGKRLARFEDLFTARLPEMSLFGVDVKTPLSIIAGLGMEVGLGAKVINGVQGLLRGGPKTLQRVEKSWDTAKGIRSDVGEKIADLFKSFQGTKAVSGARLRSVIKDVPKEVHKKIIKNPRLYKVKFDGGGNLANEAENIWRYRMAIDDAVSSKSFREEATNLTQKALKDSRSKIRDMLNLVDDKMEPLMSKYSEYSSVLDEVGDIMLTKGRVVINKAGSALKFGGEPQKQAALEKFAQTFPKAASMVQDIRKLNRNRALVAAGTGMTKLAVGGAILGKFLKPTREFISGDEVPNTGGDN